MSQTLIHGLTCLVFVASLAPPVFGQDLIMTAELSGGFIDISETGTALSLDDDGVAEISAAFDLNDTLFRGGGGSVWVSNNGAIGFLSDGTSGAFFQNQEIPNFALFGGAMGHPQALAVFWDDMDSDTGDVYFATVGEQGSRILVVQWQDRPHYSGDSELDGDEATYQIQVYEERTPVQARFIYPDVDFLDPEFDDGASATIGYQAGDFGNDVPWSFNEAGAVTNGSVLTLVALPGECSDAGDGDGDGRVELDDYLGFRFCLSGPGEDVLPGCSCYDMNEDGVVDLSDVGMFQLAFTGE